MYTGTCNRHSTFVARFKPDARLTEIVFGKKLLKMIRCSKWHGFDKLPLEMVKYAALDAVLSVEIAIVLSQWKARREALPTINATVDVFEASGKILIAAGVVETFLSDNKVTIRVD